MYKNHIIIDFEMNPVAKGNREIRQVLKKEIIEIGAIMLNEEHEVVDRFECYVCPKYNSKITKYIANLTGIKTTDVYRANLDLTHLFMENKISFRMQQACGKEKKR